MTDKELIAELMGALEAVSIMLGDFIVAGRATEQTRDISRRVRNALVLAKVQSPTQHTPRDGGRMDLVNARFEEDGDM